MHCPKCKERITSPACKCGHKINFKNIPDPPKRLGEINDYEAVLESVYVEKMRGIISQLEKDTGVEIAITVIGSTKPLSPDNYAYYLYDRWKIGKAKNQGILILLAMQSKAIETEIGFGLENIISEEYTEKLLDETIIPYFKKYKYGEGLFESVKLLAAEIRALLS